MNLRIAALTVVFLSQSVFANAGDPSAAPAPPCIAVGNVTPICGLQAPEDLELLPNGKQLLIGEIPGGADHKTGGGLAVMDLAGDVVRPMEIRNEYKAGWGENSCTTPPVKLAPHGIHLSKRNDGIWQILVVNHLERESIEMLELVPTKDSYSAIWRGCVVNATKGMHNDVVATPEGGFIATVMLDKAMFARPDALTEILSGIDTGYLVEWRPGTGMVKLPNSEAPFNNGVQLSPDGNYAIFASWTGKQIRKYDRKAQRVSATADLSFYPDNLTVRDDGQLVIAGIDELASWKRCLETRSSFCLTAFDVAAIDPRTLSVTPLYHANPGTLAGASAALQVRQTLYIGTYAGDRLLKVVLAP
jgi:hypothetical protein